MNPSERFVPMFAARPAHEHGSNVLIGSAVDFLGNHVPMIVGPSLQDGIEFADENGCVRPVAAPNAVTRLFQHAAHALPRGFDQQFLSEFAQALTQEIKSLVNACDDGLFRRERESALPQETDDGGFDLLLQDFPRRGGDNEVIRVTDEVDFVATGFDRGADGLFHSVEGEVGQHGRGDAALRSAGGGGEKPLVLHEPGFEPLSEDSPIHDHVIEQPLMADLVEAAFDVAFEDPLRRVVSGQHDETLPDGVGAAAAFPESVGVPVGAGFRDGLQGEHVQGLLSTIQQGWNAQRPEFSVFLLNVNPPKRLRLIAAAFELRDRVELLAVGAPHLVVHPGCAGPFVLRHSLHG